MHYLFNKRTFLGLVGILLLVGLVANPGWTNKVDAAGGNHPYLAETVFWGPNATWKYFMTRTTPGTGWNLPGFNDSAWNSGSAPIGYGSSGLRTTIGYGSDANNKYPTTYFRKTFTFTNAASVSSLAIDLQADDGAVVYLNGKVVAQRNMPSTVSYNTWASSCVDALTPTTIAIDPKALVEGSNTIAVEVHQCSANSVDLTFGLALHGTLGGVTVPQPTSAPTSQPTAKPTVQPTAQPTAQPTIPAVTGNAYYVTTGGSSSGDGSSSRPWSLAYALKQPAVLRGGDTIWVRGGTYTGPFVSYLKGASTSAPLTLRAVPGERAILRVTNGSPVLDIYANAYVNFWGLEITSSYSSRDSVSNPSNYGIRVNQGVASHHVKFINMIIHDVQAQGMGWWQALTDSEVYGSLLYFNGTTKLDHGAYVHNVSGTKTLANNFIFDNASHGIHGYAETAEKGLNNIVIDGNTLFNNGSIGGTYKRDILLGGLTTTYNGVITNNYTYYPGTSGQSLNLGYTAGSSGAKVQNNYFAGGQFVAGGSSLTITGNMVYAPGGIGGISTSSFPNNTWTTTKPSGYRYYIRPNKYDPTMANLTIYNWNKQSSVALTSSVLAVWSNLKAGDRVELHNAQNYFGDVVTLVYDGTSLNVPMTGHSVAQPLALSKPATTFPEFGAFLMINRGH